MKKLFLLLLSTLLFAFVQIDSDPKKIFERGNYFYKSGKYKEALLELNLVIKIDSLFVDAYYVRSFVYRSLREYAKGLNDMEYYIKLNKKNPEAYLEIATIRKEIYQNDYTGGNMQYAESENIDKETIYKSISDVNEAIKIDSSFAKAYYCKGSWIEYLGRCSETLGLENQRDSIFHQAINLYSKAIQLSN